MNLQNLSEAELTEMLVADGELVTERLDHWARVSGDRTFIYYGEDDVIVSFSEFAARTDAIAGNLVRQGIGRGDRVCVLSRNSMVSALMMFGIWKAGAVYSPVNFAFTGRLLTYTLNDAAPSLVVTDDTMLPTLNEVTGTLQRAPAIAVYHAPEGAHDFVADKVDIDSTFNAVSWDELTRDCAAPDIALSFDDPANLIYTSGTTGPAKGVVQPHRWMAQYTFLLRSMLTSDDVIYNDLPMYHVGGAVANVCRAAWVGCEVAAWNRFSPDAFWNRIAARGATTAILLDVMIPWLIKAPAGPDDRANTLSKVHMQPLSLHHNEFARRFGVDFISTGFGQSESGAVFFAVMEETAPGEGTPHELYRGRSHAEMREVCERSGVPTMAGTDARAARKGYMGLPSPFHEVAVRNEQDEACPPEVAGHLTLRPRLPGTLMQGYLGKGEATVSAFQNLWFHTGDAVVKARDGHYYFEDRLGDRIRVRGENLSSYQIEDMIGQHPDVQMVAALAIPSREGDEDEVVVFVTPLTNSLDEQTIHRFAARTMPKYMRPAHVRVVSELPQTATNKVEKYRLRQRIVEELAECN